MRRKATGLKVTKPKVAGLPKIGYEVKRLFCDSILDCSLPINAVGVMLLEVGLQRPQGDKDECLLYFTERTNS